MRPVQSLSTAALPGVARQTEAQIKAMVAEACTLGAALRRQVDVEDQYLVGAVFLLFFLPLGAGGAPEQSKVCRGGAC